jgi:hypothetical protein
MPGILYTANMYIEYVNYIPGSNTPARVFHNSGKIQVNLQRFNTLPEFTKKFVLKHEEGHYIGKTNNEFLADEYAFNKLALKEPYSLRNSILAISDVLPMTTREHNERVQKQIIRSLVTDAQVNKNPKAIEALKKMNISVPYEGAEKVDSKTITIVIFVVLLALLIIILIKKSK